MSKNNEYGFEYPDDEPKNNNQVDDSEGSYKRLLNGKEITLWWLLQHYSAENAKAYREQQEAKKAEKEAKKKKNDPPQPEPPQPELPQPELPQPEPDTDDVTIEIRSYPKRYRAELECLGYSQTVPVNKNKFVIGRDKKNTNLCITNNPCIGRMHAQIITEDESFFIVDMNSLNKTFVNERELVAERKQELFDGDKIKLANEEFIFRVRY